MINVNYDNLNSPIRSIKGKVELLGSSSALTSISGETITLTEAITDLEVKLTSDTIADFSEVKVFGYSSKNLLDGNEDNTINGATSKNYTIIDNTITFADALSLFGTKMPVKPGQPYTISFKMSGYDETRSTRLLIREYETEPTALDGTQTQVNFTALATTGDTKYYTFTPGEATTWLTVGFYCGYASQITELQVEKGSTATEYEAPSIQTATASADGTVTGITATGSSMTLLTYTDGIIINASYTEAGATAPGAEYTYNDALKSFTIERTGEQGKFFGFGVNQKLETKLVDKNREIELAKDEQLMAWLGVEEYISAFPIFYISETKRDEKTNELTVVAYDKLTAAAAHTVSELSLQVPYTIGEFAEECADFLGLDISDISDASFNTLYEAGANFEGTETLRDALNAIAEATQTIYYIDKSNSLVFKRLDKIGEPVLNIDKTQYMELSCNPGCRLSAITHATELGDNLTASTGEEGVTQVVRDNAFWELREDAATLLDNALAAIGGLSIVPFECSWRGNYLLEIGDKIGLITKDDETVNSFVLDDSLTYNGGLSEKTQWSYTENESETVSSNPTTLGEALKQTFAKVDKANKTINLVASESKEAIETLNGELEVIRQQAELTVTPEEVEIAIKKELSNGVDGVYTKKGFSFDDNGMMVENTDSEGNRISPTATQISENGMKIYDSEDSEVLIANNIGVNAANLHATTYLIIGNNSRLEDFERNGEARTGCFWIGG